MKVFITGIGSDLGTQIARLLEQKNEITQIGGVDMYPPRRYLSRSKFFMSHYNDSERITELISHFNPDVIINFGVYEPGSRLGFSRARDATHASVAGIAHAIKKLNDKKIHVITRSSVVVYGFNDPHKTYDETSPLSPDTLYAEMCRDAEEELMAYADRLTVIRTAPEIGAHVPHPLARILTLRAVPVQLRSPLSKEVGFPLISPRDAVDIFVKATLGKPDRRKVRILHAACSDNATMMMAARQGHRIPLFFSGVGFSVAKQLTYFAGAPMDPHIEMMIRRGLRIDSTATRMYLGITSQDSPTQIMRDLFKGEEKAVESSIVFEVQNEIR